MTAPMVFLDTETDGVHPGRKAWEVGMIRRDQHGERATSFFLDIDLATADPFGLKIGGFYDRHPMGRILANQASSQGPLAWKERVHSPMLAATEIARWTHGAHIVGAVPNFDTEVLATLLRDHGLTPAWHYHLIDVENLAVGYLMRHAAEWEGPDSDKVRATATPPWKSDDLGLALGVEPPTDAERHTAMGDARWAMRIYDLVMGT